MSGATNVTVYRCPTCTDIVIIVPPGFEGPTDEEIRVKTEAHNKKHDETRQIVEGEE